MAYFECATQVTTAVGAVYHAVGNKITERREVYHRGAFYSDVATAIHALLDLNTFPFVESEYNWRWWADELDKRALALGMDASYAMRLPPRREPGDPEQYEQISNQIDEFVAKLAMYYAQEMADSDESQFGKITAAECVKLTHRLARFILPSYCWTIIKPTPEHPGVRTTWPWLVAVQNELQFAYRAMGEPDKAGSAWNIVPGAPAPPISWPGV